MVLQHAAMQGAECVAALKTFARGYTIKASAMKQSGRASSCMSLPPLPFLVTGAGIPVEIACSYPVRHSEAVVGGRWKRSGTLS